MIQTLLVAYYFKPSGTCFVHSLTQDRLWGMTNQWKKWMNWLKSSILVRGRAYFDTSPPPSVGHLQGCLVWLPTTRKESGHLWDQHSPDCLLSSFVQTICTCIAVDLRYAEMIHPKHRVPCTYKVLQQSIQMREHDHDHDSPVESGIREMPKSDGWMQYGWIGSAFKGKVFHQTNGNWQPHSAQF